MARFNPNMMMTDGGGDTAPNNPTLKTQFTPAQMQAIIRKLTSGQRLTPEEAAAVGVSEPSSISTPTQTPIVPTPPTVTWTKASTVNTANGPVDVDANGLAADGSRPVAFVASTTNTGLPAGFTAGPFPTELEAFFGSSAGILGYRIETLRDKNGRTYNQLSVATGPNSSKTFGARFTQGADGKYSIFTADPNDGAGNDGAGNDGGDGSSSGQTYTAPDGRIFTDIKAYNAYIEKTKTDEKRRAGQSAYDILFNEFDRYGLGSLVQEVQQYIVDGLSPAEFTLKLRASKSYQKRFAANEMRINKGLKAISEAEYLGLEDKYQSILRNAGLPESYWKRGDLGVQEGFTNFIANDVSAVELEDRVTTAQQRLIYANPEVSIALKTFYPDITNGDLLAYALDPTKGLDQIKRRITAAEVGSSAVQLGLATNVTDAEYLARYGVTKQTAQQGYSTIAGGLQRGSQLASIYGQDPYTQTTAEREVFNVPGAKEAREQRQKITGLEKATFGGQTGITGGALARDRAGNF
jgi:hypothetical protein